MLHSVSTKFTDKKKTFSKILAWITEQNRNNPDRYLLVDCHPRCADFNKLRYRTAIFPRPTPLHGMQIMPIFFMPHKDK